MKTKRLLTLALAMLMLLAFAAACNNTPAANSPPPAGNSPTPNNTASTDDKGEDEIVELRVLNYLDMSAPSALEEIEVVWKAFDNAHPNIKITREDEFNEPFHESVEAYAAAGMLPDVMLAWPSGRSTTLHTKRLLKDLAPLVARDGLANNYFPSVLDPSAQVGGYLAILPQGVTATHIFLVNSEVLDAVGLTPAKTYSELAAQAPILRAAGYDTVLMANQDSWVMQSCLFSMIAGRFMGENWDQRILSGETDFNDPDFIASLDFIKKMYDDGVLAQSTLALGYGDAPGQFANNKAAYCIDGDWRVADFITDATTGEALIAPDRQDKFKITVFPEIDGVKFNKSNSTVIATGYGINANLEDGSAKLEAAWELVKWLVGKDVQTFKLGAGTFTNPARNDIDFSSLTLEPLQVALANLSKEYDVSTVVIDGVFEGPIYTPMNDGLQALGLGTQTATQVAQNTQIAFDAWKAAR